MPKTIWVDGSILQPVFMDTFFGNDAVTGHVHTGTNDDGSAPKVDLANHVVGILNSVHLITTGNTTVEGDFGSGFTGSFTLQYKAAAEFTNMHFGVVFSGTPAGSPSVIKIQPTGAANWDSDFFGTVAWETALVRATHGTDGVGVTFKYTNVSTPIDITIIESGSPLWTNPMSISQNQQIIFFKLQ